MRARALAFLGPALILFFSARAVDCPAECRPEPLCQKEILDCLLRAGESRAAVEHFKKLIREKPDSFEYALYMARAYQADGNTAWAKRTLLGALEENPPNCARRAWLAWLETGEGNLQAADELLGQEGCPGGGAEENRFLLIRAVASGARESQDVKPLLERLARAQVFFRGDHYLYRQLLQRHFPGRPEPLELRLENAWGYTSNARAGAPSDPDSRGASSVLGRLDVFGRLVWPGAGWLKPALEAGMKAHGLGAGKERQFSYLELSARPGILLGDHPRILVGYHADYLVLARDTEAERRLYEGHRAELDFDLGSFVFFAGFGRRIFRESGRTRFELDGGCGGSFPLGERLSVLGALSLRVYQARGAPYDLYGGTALAAGRLRLGGGFFGRLLLSVGYDDYHNSAGALGLLAYGSESRRRDVLLKSGIELWTPAWNGLRAGGGYELAWRNSTLDQSNSTDVYDYTEHRLMLRLRWEFSWDFYAPRLEDPPAGLGLAEAAPAHSDLERIQDLLRQDEAARRGSSCVQ